MINTSTPQGVGLLIHQDKTDRFYVQCKDQTYPNEKYIGSYAFWGGLVEQSDNTVGQALLRELTEEFNLDGAIIHRWPIQFLGIFEVRHSSVSYDLHVYYLSLNERSFAQVTRQTVNEGIGVVRSGMELAQSQWIWDTSYVFRAVYENF